MNADLCTCGMAEQERTGHAPQHENWCELAEEHGTYAAYQREKRRKESPCDACRAANAEYQRRHRSSSAERRQKDRDYSTAQSRAWIRLAQHHPTEFGWLLIEERQRIAEERAG